MTVFMVTSRHLSLPSLTPVEPWWWWSRELQTVLHFSHSEHSCCSPLPIDSCNSHECSDQDLQQNVGHQGPGSGGDIPSTTLTLSQSYPASPWSDWGLIWLISGYTGHKYTASNCWPNSLTALHQLMMVPMAGTSSHWHQHRQLWPGLSRSRTCGHVTASLLCLLSLQYQWMCVVRSCIYR